MSHRIPVLVQTQPAARVLDKQVQQPDLVVLNLGHLLEHQVGNEVRPARLGGQGEVPLRPGHGGGGGVVVCRGANEGGEDQAQGERPEEVERAGEEGEEHQQEEEEGGGG